MQDLTPCSQDLTPCSACSARPGIRAALTGLLGHTDILLPSEGELTVLVGCESEEQAIARAFEHGVTEIVLKCGSDGCHYHTPQGSRKVPGFSATEIDPTGAGDSFGATFCTLRSQGMQAADALVYANAAGASAVSRWGAMEGTSTRQQMEAFVTSERGGRQSS